MLTFHSIVCPSILEHPRTQSHGTTYFLVSLLTSTSLPQSDKTCPPPPNGGRVHVFASLIKKPEGKGAHEEYIHRLALFEADVSFLHDFIKNKTKSGHFFSV
jgi:hypothetical protein